MLRHSATSIRQVPLALVATLSLLVSALGLVTPALATEPAAPAATCPSGTAQISSYSYTVTRGSATMTVARLHDVQPGDKVQANFTIADGCTGLSVLFISYMASGNTSGTANPQTKFDSARGVFDAGAHSLGPIDIPDCFFQADLKVGTSVRDATLGGTTSCAPTPTPTPTPTGMVMVMKHVCPAGMTPAQFDAIPTFAQKVFTCPVITLPGDEAAAGARDARNLDNSPFPNGTGAFGFTVTSSAGAMTLADATFSPAPTTCPETGPCIEVSHYVFDVPVGTVTVHETQPPANYTFGRALFTPNSGDDATLVAISNGTITLDTSKDTTPDNGVMLHVYNFTGEGGEHPATSTPTPTATPEENVQGTTGTPAASRAPESSVKGTTGLPNTSTGDSSTSLLLVVLAGLLLITSAGSLVAVNVRSVRRRR